MSKMYKVDDYYYNKIPGTDHTYLEDLFSASTQYQNSPFFSNIYIPIKLVTSTGLADDYTYINVGLTTEEIAEIYYAQYSGNYLLGKNPPYKDMVDDEEQVIKRAGAIFKKNLGKYLRLLELEGYEYNPLWNVDGTEIRQNLENHGETDREYGGIDSVVGTNYANSQTTHTSSTFDQSLKTEYQDTYAGTGTASDKVQYVMENTEGADKGKIEVKNASLSGAPETVTYTTNGHKNTEKETHKSAKNIVNGEEVEYVVNASDTAFGTALVGGDRMYVEKYVRQGNIGVTKTTELIESQRNIVKFVILQQFFDDINDVILIGLYGNYC